MPRSQKEMNEQIREERRQLILMTALRIFTRRSFAATKMTDISAEASISYGLTYYYFKSKEEIYLELMKQAAVASSTLIRSVAAGGKSDPAGQLRRLTSTILDGIRNKSYAAYYFVLCAQALTSDSTPENVAKTVNELMGLLEDLSGIIANGQRTGQIRPGDPTDMAVASFSMILGLSSLMISGKITRLPSSDLLDRIFI